MENIEAQNLVLNPSFEEKTDSLVNNTNFIGVKYWREPTDGGSVYLYKEGCKDNLKCRGFNKARSGDACAGISLFATQVRIIGGWSYIQGKLKKPLEEGKIYNVNFYLLQADSSPIAVNQISVLFSVGTRKFKGTARYPGKPQVINTSGKYFISNRKWMYFSEKFIAKGGERFITIGNFSSIEKTPYKLIDKGFWKRNNIVRPNLLSSDYILEAFYFIDDVSVSETNLIDDLGRVSSIYFENNSSILPPTSKEKLAKLFKLKATNLSNYIIVVEGYTDQNGEEMTNDLLSQKRAKSVADYLIENGMPSDRIEIKAFGETMAKGIDNTSDRRVDIFLKAKK